MRKSYDLMNKDRKIASFDLVRVGDEFSYYYDVDHMRICEADIYNRAIGKMKFSDFLESRKAPVHRAHIQEMFQYLNFEDITNYLDTTYGLSLIDTLWVRPENTDIAWEKINLYENEFSDVVAHYAFSGTGLYGRQFKTTSPEFSTDGALPKCWIRRDGKILLKKGSTDYLHFRNSGFEPYAEYYAAQVAERTQILPCVKYDLEMRDHQVYSLCPLFTSQSTGYFSMARLLNIYGMDAPDGHIQLLRQFDLLSEYYDLVFFDCIVCNTDRHLGNFGVLVDTETYRPVALSPIFDNGMSLGHLWMPDHEIDIVEYASSNRPSLFRGGNFSQIGHSLLNPARRAALERLSGWSVRKHPLYNWNDDKFKGMNRLLQSMARKIVG